MNKFEPEKTYTGQAVREFDDGQEPAERSPAPGALNSVANQVAAQYRRENLSPVMVSGLFRLTEFAFVAGTGFLIFLLYVGIRSPMMLDYCIAITLGSLATSVLFEFGGNYRMSVLRDPVSRIGHLLLTWCGVFALIAIAGFFMKNSAEFSRFWFASWFGTGLASIFILRFIISRLIRRWARNGTMERRAVIVGGGSSAEQLIRSVERQPANDIRVCGIFDDRDDVRSPPIVAGYPKLGTIGELIEFARIARIDMLIVALPLTAEKRVLTLLKKIWVLPVDIRLSAHANQLQFHRRSYSFIGSVPMLDIFDKPINDWESVAKRIFDIVFSVAGLILLSPVMAATAVAIKLESKGPVFFKQKRHGFNNEIVDVYKFRSMYVDQCDPTARNAVTKNDPRVTRVGRFIRKTSIDELPQFFNSLAGSLSLVGPRPHAVTAQSHNRLYHEVVDGYFARHRVKPGVTGWAQINGWRGEVDSDDKIRMRTEFDLYYIENWSLWFDLKILLMTPIRLMNTENAY